MWLVYVSSIFILLGSLSSAQNPYALKRPSYCTTCFSNDQNQNYYCCFYFFRCCAESRLGSSNRKITTPGPEYPDLSSTQRENIITTKESPLQSPGESKGKKCAPAGNSKTGDSERPGASNVASSCRDEDGTQNTASVVQESKTPGVNAPKNVENSRQGTTNNSRPLSSEDTSYSSAYGGKRYPYNVPRVYPAQQPGRNTEWRPPQNRYNNGVTGSVRSTKPRLGQAIGKESLDSTEGKVQSNTEAQADNADDVFWGRMEPVKDIDDKS